MRLLVNKMNNSSLGMIRTATAVDAIITADEIRQWTLILRV
jgi:hypothetical protein